jgi:virginiamycin B lyase
MRTIHRSFLAVSLSLACLLPLAGIAGAAPPDGVATFKVPVCESGDLAPASRRGVFVPLCEDWGNGRKSATLGTLLPNGKLLKRSLPGGAAGPFAVGPAGEIWAGTGAGGLNLGLDRIAADGTITRFPLGTAKEGHALEIYGLVPAGEGSVWVATGELASESYFRFYDSLGGELVHVAADGTVTRFAVPEGVEPHALVRGPDGNLWFVGESGRSATEHTSYLGKGYVGRMTPTGEFALFPTATEQSAPGGIAVGPDGGLWFTEASTLTRELATIATDGTFGPSTKVRNGYIQGPLSFGPEGDARLTVLNGLMRITPQDQQTLFPLQEAQGVVAGAEGDIWTRRFKQVQRIVPGAPGIDTVNIEADRSTKTVHIQLACGGSRRGCKGILELSLAQSRGTVPGTRLARAHYSVAAESRRELTIHLRTDAFALVRNAVPKRAGPAYVAPLVVHVTVTGGPTLDRRFYVPGLVTK